MAKKKMRKPRKNIFLGYCPGRDCGSMIAKIDLESPRIFVCQSCGKRAQINKLKTKTLKLETDEVDLESVSQNDLPPMRPQSELPNELVEAIEAGNEYSLNVAQ